MPGFETKLKKLITEMTALLTERNWRMATAESCTGGWIAKCCTDVVGSSEWFDRAYVVYSYRAKEQMLGVSHDDLVEHGAVSEEVAGQMALGAKKHSNVAVTVSATGIAGPGGGMPGKPVGLVHFGWCIGSQPVDCDAKVFEGDRNSVRQQTVLHALEGIISRLDT
ncbi:MAG: CinA family protein [Gammaproteobacteria bacterium]|nr:CinA family protein [Gammaproteobacteria bacterium]